MPRTPIALVLAASAFGTALVALAPSGDAWHPHGRPGYLAAGASYYATPVQHSDGSVDNARTMMRLNAIEGREYWYLLYPKSRGRMPRDWENLPAFLTLARQYGINVRVVLGPPQSSSSAERPCTGDLMYPYPENYPRWMREIGILAREHPNVIGAGIDDFIAAKTCTEFMRGAGSGGYLERILRKYSGRPLTLSNTIYMNDFVPRFSRTRYAWFRAYCEASRPTEVTYAYISAYNAQARVGYGQSVRQLLEACPSVQRITTMVYAGGRDRPDLWDWKVRTWHTAFWTWQATRIRSRIVYYAYQL